MIESGYDVFSYNISVYSLLKSGKFTKEFIFNLGRYTVFEMIEGGFTQFDLNPKGYYFLTPTNSYELRVSLNSDFTDIYINQNLLLNFGNLINGNTNQKRIKDITTKAVIISYNN